MSLLEEFAQFVRLHHLDEFTRQNLQVLKDKELPILKFTHHLDDSELFNMGMKDNEKFLRALEEGDAVKRALATIDRWEHDKLRGIPKEAVSVTDIVSIYAYQRQSLLVFLPEFTKSVDAAVEVFKGLEEYYVQVKEMAFKVLLKIQKEHKQQLDEREAWYRTLTRNLPKSSVLLYDKNLHFILAEGEALTLAGLSRENVKEKHLKEVVDPKSYEELQPRYQSALEGEEHEFEIEFKGEDYLVNILPVRDSSGDIIAGMVVSQVITDIRQAEQELKSKVEELQRSNEDLERFAYVASHDLQEPLRKVQSFSNILKNKYQDVVDQTGVDYIDRMQDACSRMQTLIDDLLIFSRVTRNEDVPSPVDLNRVMKEVLSDLSDTIREKKAMVTVAEQLPVIEANAGQINHLFQNLISNALKFHDNGRVPKVQLTAEKLNGTAMKGMNSDTLDPDGEYVKIEVQDNGIGFDPKFDEKIFVIFQRLHSRSEFRGTGIGLAICRKIVEQHNGMITARSTPGKGSVFTVVLPIKQNESH